MIEDKVLEYIKQNNKVYTKTMYVALDVKRSYGMSLNKFRLFLQELDKQEKIKEVFTDKYSYWSINHAK